VDREEKREKRKRRGREIHTQKEHTERETTHTLAHALYLKNSRISPESALTSADSAMGFGLWGALEANRPTLLGG
jgi:hypothetical protein